MKSYRRRKSNNARGEFNQKFGPTSFEFLQLILKFTSTLFSLESNDDCLNENYLHFKADLMKLAPLYFGLVCHQLTFFQ